MAGRHGRAPRACRGWRRVSRERGGAQGTAGRLRASVDDRAQPDRGRCRSSSSACSALLLVGGIALSLSSAPLARPAATPGAAPGHHVRIGIRSRRHQLGRRRSASGRPVRSQPHQTVVFRRRVPGARRRRGDRGRTRTGAPCRDHRRSATGRFRRTGSTVDRARRRAEASARGRWRRSCPRCRARRAPPRSPSTATSTASCRPHLRTLLTTLLGVRPSAVVVAAPDRGGARRELTDETITATDRRRAAGGGPGLLRHRLGAPGDRTPDPSPWCRGSASSEPAGRRERAPGPGRRARGSGSPDRLSEPRSGWIASRETGFTFRGGEREGLRPAVHRW